jgi:hypothetical protein
MTRGSMVKLFCGQCRAMLYGSVPLCKGGNNVPWYHWAVIVAVILAFVRFTLVMRLGDSEGDRGYLVGIASGLMLLAVGLGLVLAVGAPLVAAR